ncbi:Ras-related protein Rab-32 [Hypsibius exemplaris]|uniref:Ras-related protein Rab n=1 Tax=Hypsibius exemplaris TaxID=2072580 RepID=A0A1W0X423_HYPEX|nr:Ras-related protein Rab-32 [Hypsibius exemplaris]
MAAVESIPSTTGQGQQILVSLVEKPVVPPVKRLSVTTQEDATVPSSSSRHVITSQSQPLPYAATQMSISPPPSLLRSDGKRREKLYKVLVIGDIGVGKTSVVKRYVHRFFSQQYRATIGVDFALKIINWDQNTVIRLQLWDIAGQERFGHMTRVYYKDAVGAFIVFDTTRGATFDAVAKWKKDLDQKVELPDGKLVPCVLLGNKCDQPRDSQTPEGTRMDQFLKENEFSGFFETSAKENIGIDQAARFLLSKIIENDSPVPQELDKDRLRLDGTGPIGRTSTQEPNNCSC